MTERQELQELINSCRREYDALAKQAERCGNDLKLLIARQKDVRTNEVEELIIGPPEMDEGSQVPIWLGKHGVNVMVQIGQRGANNLV